jgi:hypothetical protein
MRGQYCVAATLHPSSEAGDWRLHCRILRKMASWLSISSLTQDSVEPLVALTSSLILFWKWSWRSWMARRWAGKWGLVRLRCVMECI